MNDVFPDAFTLMQTLGISGIFLFLTYKLFVYVINNKLGEFNDTVKKVEDILRTMKKVEEFIIDPTTHNGRPLPIVKIHELLKVDLGKIERLSKNIDMRLDTIDESLSRKCEIEKCPMLDTCKDKTLDLNNSVEKISNMLNTFSTEARESRIKTRELISDIGESINKFISEFGLQLIEIVKSAMRKE
jgi:LytS/YehU family sensor histidine kinase